MWRNPCFVWRIASLVLGIALAGVACGQTLADPVSQSTATQSPEAAPDAEKDGGPVASLRQRITASDDSDEVKKQNLAIVDRAEKQIEEIKTKSALTAKRQASLATIEQRAEAARRGLDNLRDFKPVRPNMTTLVELESELGSLTAQSEAIRRTVSDAETAMKASVQRRAEIDAEIPRLNIAREERAQQLATAIAAADGTIAGEALVTDLRTSLEGIDASIEAITAEKALLDAEAAASLPQLIRDFEARKSETLDQQLDVVRAMVESKRGQDAADRVQKANQDIHQLHPLLRSIGAENQQLAELNQSLTQKIETTADILMMRTEQLEELNTAVDQATSRVQEVGLTDAVGAMLRNLKQRLPSVGAYRLRIRERGDEIDDANFELMDLTDRRNAKISLTIDSLMRSAEPPIPYDLRDELREETRELLQIQRTEYLDPVIKTQTNYFNNLVSISAAEGQIIELVEKARQYINENVLWTRSTKPLYSDPLPNRHEFWFTYPSAWSNVMPRLYDDVLQRPGTWLAGLCALLTLVVSRYKLREEIFRIGEAAAQSTYTQFVPTVKAMVWTVATSIPVPLTFWFLGDRFGTIAGSDRTLMALSMAASTFAYSYFPLEIIRQVCRSQGLAQAHFDWPQSAISKVRRTIRLLLFGAVPMRSAAAFMAGGSIGYGNDVLERYLSLASSAILGLFVYRIAHPHKGAPAAYLIKHPAGWMNRLSYMWFPALIAIPFALAVLSVIGYHFTATQLGWRVFQSAALLFAIGVAISLVMRWSLVHRRQIRIEHAKRVRAQMAKSSVGDPTMPPVPMETPEELREQMQQSRNLFRTAMLAAALIGLWIVWTDVVPALSYFEHWSLGTTLNTVTMEVRDENGVESVVTRQVLDRITITDVGLAVLILVVTIAAVRNLPGLLEFSVLRRLPLDRSIRYAITALVSYAIVLLGLLVACGSVGLHWDQIQWMATALTFGLAFGLQEMFANFIAGIIILFEQPVRVGDVVEIDGITGVVSKIRIRATTITNWDRKDYIVPNKEFITGKLLNWTRSDEIIRITIHVGIAYGSDTVLARRLLTSTAEEHPDVLKDPPILATFDRFGDNSLNFTLRAFVRTFERRLHIENDLHMAIDRKFRAANIEISFPQRDLHLRSLPTTLIDFIEQGRSERREDEVLAEQHHG